MDLSSFAERLLDWMAPAGDPPVDHANSDAAASAGDAAGAATAPAPIQDQALVTGSLPDPWSSGDLSDFSSQSASVGSSDSTDVASFAGPLPDDIPAVVEPHGSSGPLQIPSLEFSPVQTTVPQDNEIKLIPVNVTGSADATETGGPAIPFVFMHEAPPAPVPIGASQDSIPNTVLIDGDGEVVTALNSSVGSHGGTTGGTSGGTSSGSSTTTGSDSTSPFVINVTYDSSVNSAPAAFKTVVNEVVQYLESQFTDHVTINIDIGYGEVGGYTLGRGALGESLTYLSSFSYAQVRNSLISDATTADDATAVATLPVNSPVNGTFWESTAEAKATGLLGASSAIDGYVGVATGNLFDYDDSNGVSAGQYDLFGVLAHELTEVMGRSLLVGGSIGGTPNGYYPLDLFHYSANGVRDFSGTRAGYFSVDGGATNLDNFNTNSGGDFGDWAASAGNDSFLAFSPSGTVDAVSPTDLRAMDVIGWNLASSGSSSSSPPPPPPALPDLTVSGLSFTGAHFNYTVNNGGAGDAAASTAGIYMSSTPTGRETLIGTIATGALAAGASETDNGVITWASNTAAGTYYISVAADSQKTITESNETNNESSKIALVLGNSAANSLTGTAGNDVLIGRGGADTLTGKGGADQFVFNTALKNGMAVTKIADFNHAQGDLVDLDHTVFTALTNVGVGASLATADFYASSKGTAHLATDHILYNTTTGALSYDPDGTGSAAAIQFAVVSGHPALTAHDFMLV